MGLSVRIVKGLLVEIEKVSTSRFFFSFLGKGLTFGRLKFGKVQWQEGKKLDF